MGVGKGGVMFDVSLRYFRRGNYHPDYYQEKLKRNSILEIANDYSDGQVIITG